MQMIDRTLLEKECPSLPLIELIIQQNQAIAVAAEEHWQSRCDLSSWSVGEHVEHLIYTSKTGLFLLLEALDSSNKEPMHELGQELLRRGAFPRGETQAPDFALPKGMSPKKLLSSTQRLLTSAIALRERSTAIESDSATSLHPILGGFSARNWLQFIALHQHHHLQIISEIISQKSS